MDWIPTETICLMEFMGKNGVSASNVCIFPPNPPVTCPGH